MLDKLNKNKSKEYTGRNMVEVKCAYCGTIKEKEKRQIKPYKNHYCNRECMKLGFRKRHCWELADG